MANINDNEVFELIEGGKKVDLWKYDIPTVAESTKPYKPADVMTMDDIHNVLMGSGLFPGVGNIADATNSILYALEGEFGEAGLSAAMAIPYIGQYVTGQKMLKAAEKAGEEIITLYRGTPGWYPGRMVKEGKFISPKVIMEEGVKIGEYSKKGIFVSPSKEYAKTYMGTRYNIRGENRYDMATGKKLDKMILKFNVPKSWYTKAKKEILDIDESWYGKGSDVFIEGGLPKEFLIKAEKIDG